jgi:2'-5' RNA ligase
MKEHPNNYLFEFRLSGFARKYVRDLVLDVANRFGVQGATRKRVVPHVTMVGQFSTAYEERLIQESLDIMKNYNLLTFKFCGFRSFGGWFRGHRVLSVEIEPSPELRTLRSKLVDALDSYCKLNKYDKADWKPHATIAFKDIDKKYGQIKKCLDSKTCLSIKHYLLRITLLRNSRILYEYDFLQRRKLNRFESLDRNMRKMTMKLLKQTLKKNVSPI